MRWANRFVLLGCLLVCCGCGKGSTSSWIEKLKASESMTRIEAIHTLQERKGEAAVIVPALIDALKDEDTYVRRDAARALGSFGEEAKSAIPALQAGRNDREPSVRTASSKALSRIDPTLSAKPANPVRRNRP